MKKGCGVYKRAGTPFYWGWCSIHNNTEYFSTKLTVKTKAEQFVNKRYKELLQGRPIQKEYTSKTVDDLVDEYLKAYKNSPKKNYYNVKSLLKRSICKHLGHIQIKDLKHEDIVKYVYQRRADGLKDGSIDAEIAYGRAALRRGSKDKDRISEIFKLEGVDRLVPDENEHMFTHQDYKQFIKVCPPWLKLMVKIAYQYPVRASELRNLKFYKIDLDQKVIRLEKTKTKKPRNLKLRGSLFQDIKNWCEKAKDEDGQYIREFVFTTPRRPKSKIARQNFYKHYRTYAKKAGLYNRDGEDLTYHRLRATAASNMDRAGISHKTIMAIAGWRRYKTLLRYLGTATQEDLEIAGDKMAAYLEGLEN